MYCTKPRRFNGKFTCSLYAKYLEYVVFITMYVWHLNTIYVFKERGRVKETLEMPLGVEPSSSE